jgi:hypothetical protein
MSGITDEDYTEKAVLRNKWLLWELLLVEWPWPGVHSARAHLINYAEFQIIGDSNLTRQPNVIRQLRFHSEPVAFEFAHLSRITCLDLDAAGCATCVSTTAVKNINTSILDGQYELLAWRCVKFLQASGCLCLDLWH